jgi:steroid delta-isomerase-like uncharacterized protein
MSEGVIGRDHVNELSPAQVAATESVNLGAVAAVLEFWNTHDIDGVLRFYDPEIVWHNVAMEENYAGLAAVRGFLHELFTAFPDLVFDVTWRIARGDEIAEEWVMSGTHANSFLGIPGTGRPFTLTGMSHIVMRDGRFLSDQFYFDSGSFLRQVKLLPPLAAVRSAPGRAVLWAAVHRASLGGATLAAAAAAVAARRSLRGLRRG